MKNPGFTITLLATILIGLNAGFFYTWSFTIMQSLDLIDPQHAISAMQSINANIRNVWFATIFFGVVAVQILSLVIAIIRRKTSSAVFIGLALITVVSCISITFQMHVPWNNALGEISPTDANAAGIWTEYSAKWTQWNHWRTLSSGMSFMMMLVALVRWNRH